MLRTAKSCQRHAGEEAGGDGEETGKSAITTRATAAADTEVNKTDRHRRGRFVSESYVEAGAESRQAAEASRTTRERGNIATGDGGRPGRRGRNVTSTQEAGTKGDEAELRSPARETDGHGREHGGGVGAAVRETGRNDHHNSGIAEELERAV